MTTRTGRDTELSVLRRRAYGPDADIAADPDAARRLERLERASRAGSVGVPPEAGPDVIAEAQGLTASPSDAVTPAVRSARPGASWWRRRSTWAAATTIAVSAAVAAGVTFVAAGPRPDATLVMTGETPTEALTGNILWLISAYDIDRDTVIGHAGFADMSVWTARTETGMRCLFLTVGDTQELQTSCMPAGLDPTIDFTLYPGMTDVVGGDYPDRTALRFVFRGDGVDVWIMPPP